MNILLTGATGFIGGHLRNDLSITHQLFAIARQEQSLKKDKVKWFHGDLAGLDFLSSLPAKIDAVICLAQSRAYRQFPEKVQDIFNVNVRSTMLLLEYARCAGAHTFVFASTANVYKKSSQPIAENFVIEPLSFYARSKRMAEMLVESYAEFFNCTILRLFTVYGPGQKGMLIPNLIERVKNSSPLHVQGTHGFMTSPIYISDVKNVIRKILEEENIKPDFKILNVGGDEMLGIFELGSVIGEALDCSPKFDYLPGDEPAGWIADNSKLKSALDIEVFMPIRDGIKLVVT